MKKISINITARLLTYFLFVTVIPLFILAITSTALINSTLNDLQQLVRTIPLEYFYILKQKNSALIFNIALLTALFGVIMAYVLARIITKPIFIITDAAKVIGEGDLSKRAEIKSNDEIGYLADSFNTMVKTLQDKNREILSFNNLLIEQNKKIEAIINSSADGILTVDKNWKITSINPKLIEWTGLDKIEILGKCFYDIIEYRVKIGASIVGIDKITNLEEFSLYYPNATIKNIINHELFDLDINYSSIKTEDNLFEDNYVLILRDVTKRKEIEQLKEDFVATLTHDLRVPLLASVQTLEYLIKGSYGSLEEKQKFIIQHLILSNNDLLKMVNTLLDSYKYEAGKHVLLMEKINLNNLINECICEIQSLSSQKNHTVTFLPHCEEIKITADRHEIKRVIINLLSNAITYTSQNGKIEICTKSQKDEIIVSIKDNGAGIDEESIQNLFKRYSKESKALRKIGTGLGLYLSQHIIKAHKGKIWVESVKDKGSVFYFSLPVEIESGLSINEQQN